MLVTAGARIGPAERRTDLPGGAAGAYPLRHVRRRSGGAAAVVADALHRLVRRPRHARHPPAPRHRHAQPGRRAVPRARPTSRPTSSASRRDRPRGLRPGQPGSVLFAVADDSREPRPSCARPRSPRGAISIPPFKVTGHIHLLPEREPARGPDRADRARSCRSPRRPTGRTRSARPRRRRARGDQPRARPDPGARTSVVDPWAGLGRSAEPAARPRPSAARPRPEPDPASPRPDRLAGRRIAPALAVDRQVQPVAPLRPAAVVDRDVLVAEQGQHERELGGRDPRPVVADHPPAAADVGGVEPVAQLAAVAQPLAARLAASPRPAR